MRPFLYTTAKISIICVSLVTVVVGTCGCRRGKTFAERMTETTDCLKKQQYQGPALDHPCDKAISPDVARLVVLFKSKQVLRKIYVEIYEKLHSGQSSSLFPEGPEKPLGPKVGYFEQNAGVDTGPQISELSDHYEILTRVMEVQIGREILTEISTFFLGALKYLRASSVARYTLKFVDWVLNIFGAKAVFEGYTQEKPKDPSLRTRTPDAPETEMARKLAKELKGELEAVRILVIMEILGSDRGEAFFIEGQNQSTGQEWDVKASAFGQWLSHKKVILEQAEREGTRQQVEQQLKAGFSEDERKAFWVTHSKKQDVLNFVQGEELKMEYGFLVYLDDQILKPSLFHETTESLKETIGEGVEFIGEKLTDFMSWWSDTSEGKDPKYQAWQQARRKKKGDSYTVGNIRDYSITRVAKIESELYVYHEFWKKWRVSLKKARQSIGERIKKTDEALKGIERTLRIVLMPEEELPPHLAEPKSNPAP